MKNLLSESLKNETNKRAYIISGDQKFHRGMSLIEKYKKAVKKSNEAD